MRVLAGPGLTPERRLAMQRGVRRPAARRLRALGGPRPRRARARRAGGEDAHAPRGAPTTARRSASSAHDGAPLPAGEVGAVIVNGPSRFLGFLNNDELTRESLTDWGGYRTGDLGYARRGRPLRLRRPQQGHHPPRRRDGRAGGGRARDPAPPGRARGRDRAAARRPARRARVRGDHPRDRAARRRRSPSCRSSSSAEGVAKYTWPESVEVFEDFPRTPSLKVVKRDVVDADRRAAPATAVLTCWSALELR